ncbi:class I SAM-dependent methyltransferase [Cyanobium sp. NIES-981]|uniref:class I SAM-dependent methyltransferase n=1 Tax=Cyanobium sp. NIES-981 TaxID=1851505 RepID=UPI0007DD30D5|nr:class I SAM-dependent methyltransferase [Cyanobium sp. NIES-981]SBO42140.1 protein of unknown function [Cyanobium sp. NIES-981]
MAGQAPGPADLAALAERCLDRNRHPLCGKADVVNALGWANAYSSYLEIATPTSGGRFMAVCGRQFVHRRRALYNAPADYADGLPVHHRQEGAEGARVLQPLVESGERFDVVFLDPYHTYAASSLDLHVALQLLRPGGVIVVHDCNPPDPALTCPEFRPGEWMGQTYLAFLDLLSRCPHLDHCVVNTDWGVGLIWHAEAPSPRRFAGLPPRPGLGGMDVSDWRVFCLHRKHLLRLITVRRFLRVFAGVRLPHPG